MSKETQKVIPLEKRLIKTGLHHIFNFDTEGNGIYKEVAVVKTLKDPKGNIVEVRWIDIALMDMVDKGRLKATVTGVHADKYELWDLMSMRTLGNGKNELDYFHQLVRVTQGPGATNTSGGGGLANVQPEGNQMPGAEFSDPASGTLGGQG